MIVFVCLWRLSSWIKRSSIPFLFFCNRPKSSGVKSHWPFHLPFFRRNQGDASIWYPIFSYYKNDGSFKYCLHKISFKAEYILMSVCVLMALQVPLANFSYSKQSDPMVQRRVKKVVKQSQPHASATFKKHFNLKIHNTIINPYRRCPWCQSNLGTNTDTVCWEIHSGPFKNS